MKKISAAIITLSAVAFAVVGIGLESGKSVKAEPVTTQINEEVTTAALEISPEKPIITKIAAKKNVKKVLEKNKKGYLKVDTKVKTQPKKKSKTVATFSFNKKVKYAKYNKSWIEISYKGKLAYIQKKYIQNKKCSSKTYIAPQNTIKCYMPYTAITSTGSPQYKMQRKAYTGKYGLRKIEGRYCIAVGSYYAKKIGTYIDLTLSNGKVIKCVVGDNKADCDTDATNRIAGDGSLAEFLVDYSSLNSGIRRMGDVSYAQTKWASKIVRVKVYNKTAKY